MWWLVIVIAVFAAHGSALSGGFIWDDAGHVTRPDLQPVGGLVRIWTEIGATQQYYPVLHSAFWLEHRLWGDSPLGYHLLNLLLHAATAGLFGTLLTRLRVPGAAFAALLFAVHPVNVETVAWVAEQKNTLSAIFYLGAALAWLRFEEARTPRAYLVASLLFAIALLTKTVTATLPPALLVIAWWRRGRLDWRRDVVPLLPWFALGAAGGLFTAHFERVLIGAEGTDFTPTWLQRGLLASRIIWFYAGSLVWPSGLLFTYPRWTIDPASPAAWLYPAAAAALLATLVWLARRQRGPLAAALCFGGTLFPVLGFFNVYPFVFSYVADHFQYLADLPAFALAGAGLAALTARLPRWFVLGGAGVLLAGLAILSGRQAATYHDLFTLYETTLRGNPASWMAHENLAVALADAGRIEEAVPHLQQAVALKPDLVQGWTYLGNDLVALGRPAEAIPALERAIALKDDYAPAHRYLGKALGMVGRNADALLQLERAAQLQPNDAETESDLGLALLIASRFDDARPHFQRSIELAPDNPDFQYTFAEALVESGHPADAVPHFQAALILAPNGAQIHLGFAQLLRRLGRMPEATAEYRRALELDPSLARAR